MESQNQLLLHRTRYFGDIIGDALKFMKINIRPIVRAFFTWVVPLMVAPFLLIAMMGGLTDFMDFFSFNTEANIFQGGFATYGLMMLWLLFFLFAYIVLNVIILGTYIAYEENGNQIVTYEEVSANISRFFMNYLGSVVILILAWLLIITLIGFVSFLVVSIFAGGAAVGGGGAVGIMVLLIFLGMLGIFLFFMYFYTVLYNFPFINMREGFDVGKSWSRCFYLIKGNWWVTFGVLFVASIITSIASYAFLIPFYIVMGFGAFSTAETGDPTWMILLAAIMLIVSQIGRAFLMMYVSSCMTMKYYDLLERKEGGSLAKEIESLGENNGSLFENEGEY